MVKNPSASAGDVRGGGLIPGLGRSPEGGMATHSSIFAWRTPWTEELGGLQFMGHKRVRHKWAYIQRYNPCLTSTLTSCQFQLQFVIHNSSNCGFRGFGPYNLSHFVVQLGFPGGSDGKESSCNTGDLGLIDPLEKEMTIYPSILAWTIHG